MEMTKEQKEFVEKVENYIDAMKNSTKVAVEKRVTVSEALTTKDANIIFPKTIETILLTSAEPEYLVSKFFRTVTLSEGKSMEFINFGAIRAFEINEGAEYPEQYLDLVKFGGKATTEVKVKKYGLKVAITEEAISDSQWDLIGMHIEAAGRALARKKEEICFLEFSQHGHIVFDSTLGGTWFDANDAEVSSAADYGTEGTYFVPNETGLAPTGRGFDGNYNGTLTVQDFVDMCVSIMASGFSPTDVMMHPLCYSLFLANQNLMGMFSLGAFGGGQTGTPDLSLPKSGVTYQLPVGGLQLHFSPYIPFDEINKTFDLYIIDRNNVGVILVKETVGVEQFADPLRDIQNLKIRERYGVGVLNGGLAIAVAKNIRFAKTWAMPERSFAAMAMPTDMNNVTMDKIADL